MIGREVNWKRVITVIAEMFFYSWIAMVIIYAFGILPFSAKEMFKALFPLWFGHNWFVCCYIILCCLLPFINPFLNGLSRERYQGMLLVIVLIWSVAYTLKATTFFNSEFSLDHFFILYLIGGYIGRFGLQLRKRSAGFYLILFSSLLLLTVVGMSAGGALLESDLLVRNALYFIAGNNILQVLVSVSLFRWVIGSTAFYSRWINQVAKSVLGIYLLHQNPLLLQVIWYKISPDINYIHSDMLPLHCLIKCLLVFAGCLVVDQIRLATADKAFRRFLDSHWDTIKGKLKSIAVRFIEYLPFK